MVLNIINNNFGLVKSWQKSPRPIGVRVLFVPFWSHSKSHTKAQLERPKRLAQLDNQLLGEKYTKFWNNKKLHEMVCMWVLDTHSFSLEHTHITDWETTLLGHQVELEWRLKVFPSASNLWFWISLHQGTLSC